MNISSPRYGNWSGAQQNSRQKQQPQRRGGSDNRSGRTTKTSQFHGIFFCPWKSRNGMWSAVLPPEKGSRKEHVVGYYTTELKAKHARAEALASRPHHACDAHTQRRRNAKKRKNRMHTMRYVLTHNDPQNPQNSKKTSNTNTNQEEDHNSNNQQHQVEATSLPMIRSAAPKTNRKFLRHNILDIHQKQRYDKLDRERRRYAGPASYNNRRLFSYR